MNMLNLSQVFNRAGCELSLPGRFYSSFLCQNIPKKEVEYENVMEALPIKAPRFLEKIASHSSCIWFFLGCNNDEEKKLYGRVEHTDAVEHDGTWHIQASGSKVWAIRPLENPSGWPDQIVPQICKEYLILYF